MAQVPFFLLEKFAAPTLHLSTNFCWWCKCDWLHSALLFLLLCQFVKCAVHFAPVFTSSMLMPFLFSKPLIFLEESSQWTDLTVFFWFCRTWTKRYLITWFAGSLIAWFKSDKIKKRLFGLAARKRLSLSLPLSFSPSSYFLSFSIQKMRSYSVHKTKAVCYLASNGVHVPSLLIQRCTRRCSTSSRLSFFFENSDIHERDLESCLHHRRRETLPQDVELHDESASPLASESTRSCTLQTRNADGVLDWACRCVERGRITLTSQ